MASLRASRHGNRPVSPMTNLSDSTFLFISCVLTIGLLKIPLDSISYAYYEVFTPDALRNLHFTFYQVLTRVKARSRWQQSTFLDAKHAKPRCHSNNVFGTTVSIVVIRRREQTCPVTRANTLPTIHGIRRSTSRLSDSEKGTGRWRRVVGAFPVS
jgi:hypothetical protein